jgi:hypothetical protein
VATSTSMDMGEEAEDLCVPSAGYGDLSLLQQQEPLRSSGGGGGSSGGSFGRGVVPSSVVAEAAQYAQVLAAVVAKQAPAAVPKGAMFDNMNNLPFEEFLAMFVEQVANHGETNICYAFYKEFIADGSVVFKNLLIRHSTLLEQWAL